MSVLSLKIKGNGYKLLFILGMIPSVLIVCMKGEVGTDTAAYLSLLKLNLNQLNENIYNLEFGFLYFSKLMNFLNINAQVALNIFSLIICLILFFNLNKNKNSFIIFSALIFPIFFYDMTMNGVRYGLAFALSIPFIIEPAKKILEPNKNKFSLFLAFLNHKSSFLFVFLKVAVFLNPKRFLILILFATISFYFLKDIILIKISDYSELSSPSITSGLQPLIITFLIFVVNSFFFKINIKRNSFLLIIQVLFYLVSQISYAGLRFQFIVLFFLIISLINDQNCKNFKLYLLIMYLIGILGFMLRFRNMLQEYGLGDSPFLPYTFFW
ncbi:EpsG family protein [Acinetobacter sp. ANC 5054]|uniref:EpsG family protein n=1 Tax=Acinetobacter sp. ANC 5054 TaxID=1977877 RepID=UPI0011773DC2|nr:EpsG family protein [Acinetobacter sp. ANC 5054]